MPGHMKQTRDTMSSCTGGDANHGNLYPRMVKRLYFHELGSSSVVLSVKEWSAELTSWPGCVLFSWVAIVMVLLDVVVAGGLKSVARQGGRR
jgi:hypothetical protein